ncbi:coagulation factor 5/8 type domain protein [Kribbella flavida DSM 17836]|uniref:Coagulation factor 5/8 type domain protein n=1 Tax=Kribbella flavida (strain DSM 17836 / JCM 10339 / NBRC 14399) TaxID=479435 RepID=D2PLX0_KRIFD|nr:glycosyl hydrolase family 28-related protein [Kribbella flavida]ADB32550.1 coagulation factor 5/8 type domain protein [Kribbella flavida DSM 17836]
MPVRRRLLAALLPAVLLTGILTTPPATAATMYPSGVGADLGPTPTTLGVTPAAGADPAGLRTGTEQGRTFWRTDQAAGTSYFSFDVDRDYVDELGTDDVVVTVTYLDSGTGTLDLQYDAQADPEASADDVQLKNTGQWQTGTFALSGIAFADRLGGADLRLSGSADITVAGLRISTAGASVTLGATPVESGISVRAGDRPENLITGVQDGRSYWQTDRTAPAPGTSFFYVNVSDTYLYDNRGLVLVSVDYFDQGSGQFGLHYDSPGDTIPERFKNSEVVTYGDTATWKTHTFALPDAVMTNRSNGADFRIHHGDGAVDLKVAAVRVAKVAGALDVTEGLNDLIDAATRAHKAAREGTRDGQYPVGSRTTLLAAIDDARAVAATPGVTDVQVKAALQNLQNKLDAFTASVVDTNFAPAGTATASSGTGVANVNDRDHGTAWTSGAGDAWLQIDLETRRAVNDVRVEWAQAYSPDYTVQVSNDGQTFTTVGRTGSPGANQFSKTRFATTTARYVRIALSGSPSYVVKELQLRESPVVVPRPTLVRTVNPTEDAVVADFDATRYGADRSGRADATKAIQRALYACQDAGGGTVWLPAGRYLVKDTLEVHSFCTLRGDRRDPDQTGRDLAKGGRGGRAPDYGTVVIADLASGDDGPSLFRIGGSAGVVGVTTWYPRQSATRPVPYNYTFEIPGGAWIGNENYMMATVQDVTLLNSYRGLGISTMPSDRGTAPSSGQVHESSTIRNIRGTALFEGARAYNGADVGTWENVTFSNAYWSQAPAAFRPPAREALDSWTRANGTGLVLGDLEWDQFHKITLSDYKVGIQVVAGQRAQFTGSFLQPDIRRTGTAILVDVIDDRWGMTLAGGHVEGSAHAIRNNSRGYVKITGTETQGALSGTVHRMSGTAPTYTQRPLPAPARKSLTVVDAPHGVGYLPTADATRAVQKALDQAGRNGGGIVYLPAGWYRIGTHLTVPANVELRGASAVPNRDQSGASGGTVLHAFEGRGTAASDTATALLTLNGSRAGIRGLRVFYPEQNPGKPEGIVAYPYAVRGKGSQTYVINAGFPNAWNGIDLTTHRNDRFVVRKVAGAFFDHAISVGRSAGGRIEGVLSNGNAVTRVGYQQPHWMNEGGIFELVIDKYMRKQATIVTVDGATGLTLFNVFAYGFHDGLVVNDGQVDAFNLGTDNLGADGHTVKVVRGDVEATNLARYNGATSTGPVTLHNVMVINVNQRPVSVQASGDGTVKLLGNESEPGTYEVGAQVTATATPGSDSVFQHWTVNGDVVSTDASYSFTVTADQVLTAHFTTG